MGESEGVKDPKCGSVNFVQRFGSLNLHDHYHLAVLDGVFARDTEGHLVFHPALPPTPADLDAILARTARLSIAWLRRHGYMDDSPLEARSNDPPAQTALDACAAIAMGRGKVKSLPREGTEDDGQGAGEERPDKPALAVERDGFNLHAGVRIEAGDDLGRERLMRYGSRPPLSLERLRRLPGGRVAYRLKYIDRGRRSKHRVMTAVECMARLAAIICPPRYPLTRFAEVLAPRSKWRHEVVPKPRVQHGSCEIARAVNPAVAEAPDGKTRTAPRAKDRGGRGATLTLPPSSAASGTGASSLAPANDVVTSVALLRLSAAPAQPRDVIRLAPNVISVRHWDRLLGGVLSRSSHMSTGQGGSAEVSPWTLSNVPGATAGCA